MNEKFKALPQSLQEAFNNISIAITQRTQGTATEHNTFAKNLNTILEYIFSKEEAK